MKRPVIAEIIEGTAKVVKAELEEGLRDFLSMRKYPEADGEVENSKGGDND